MDEAGNTGQNLLDGAQPVYTLAGVSIERERAAALVSEATAGRKDAELKFATMRRGSASRQRLLNLFASADLPGDGAKVAVVHKPWMLVGKMVDLLIEPRMLEKGLQSAFYGEEVHVLITNDLHERSGKVIGETWADLEHAFLDMVRDYSAEAADRYLRLLNQARLACRDERLHLALSSMLDTSPI